MFCSECFWIMTVRNNKRRNYNTILYQYTPTEFTGCENGIHLIRVTTNFDRPQGKIHCFPLPLASLRPQRSFLKEVCPPTEL